MGGACFLTVWRPVAESDVRQRADFQASMTAAAAEAGVLQQTGRSGDIRDSGTLKPEHGCFHGNLLLHSCCDALRIQPCEFTVAFICWPQTHVFEQCSHVVNQYSALEGGAHSSKSLKQQLRMFGSMRRARSPPK